MLVVLRGFLSFFHCDICLKKILDTLKNNQKYKNKHIVILIFKNAIQFLQIKNNYILKLYKLFQKIEYI